MTTRAVPRTASASGSPVAMSSASGGAVRSRSRRMPLTAGLVAVASPRSLPMRLRVRGIAMPSVTSGAGVTGTGGSAVAAGTVTVASVVSPRGQVPSIWTCCCVTATTSSRRPTASHTIRALPPSARCAITSIAAAGVATCLRRFHSHTPAAHASSAAPTSVAGVSGELSSTPPRAGVS